MNFYEKKTNSYFSAARSEILELAPKWSETVLEIGCGTGETLNLLQKKNLCRRTVGIELFSEAAESAKMRVDEVFNWDIEKRENFDTFGKFDLILMLDVLEHLVDPWSVLEKVQEKLLKPNGKMIISIPNVRHISSLLPLLMKGDFTYKERGILDKTHLRFFTRKSSTKLVEEAGLTIEKMKRTSLDVSLNSGKLNAITCGIFSDFLTSQFIYLSRRNNSES